MEVIIDHPHHGGRKNWCRSCVLVEELRRCRSYALVGVLEIATWILKNSDTNATA